jgi:hypothetical protein
MHLTHRPVMGQTLVALMLLLQLALLLQMLRAVVLPQ